MNCMKDIFDEDSLGICSAELNIAQFSNALQQVICGYMEYICRPQVEIQRRVCTPCLDLRNLLLRAIQRSS